MSCNGNGNKQQQGEQNCILVEHQGFSYLKISAVVQHSHSKKILASYRSRQENLTCERGIPELTGGQEGDGERIVSKTRRMPFMSCQWALATSKIPRWTGGNCARNFYAAIKFHELTASSMNLPLVGGKHCGWISIVSINLKLSSPNLRSTTWLIPALIHFRSFLIQISGTKVDLSLGDQAGSLPSNSIGREGKLSH